jgi:hypothetical protein
MVVACLTTAKVVADNSQNTPPTPAPSKPASAAPQKPLTDLTKPIFSPAKNAIANKQTTGPSAGTSPSGGDDGVTDLPPPDTLPGASKNSALPDDNPMGQLDPDGVPLSVVNGHRERPSQAMIEAYLKQRAAAADDNKDWLLREYEKQQQAREAKDNANAPNLYSELSANKDLARLAGIPVDDSNAKTGGATFRTGDTSKNNSDNLDLRKDADTAAVDAAKQAAKPMISFAPVSATDISAPMPFQFTTSFDNVVSNAAAPAKANEAEEASELDTPGAISDNNKDSSLTDAPNSDQSLEFLPGESTTSARAHQDVNSGAELSLPMDSGQLHKDEATSLQVAQPYRPPDVDKTATVAPGPPAPPPNPDQNPNAPVPVSQVPIPSARAPISNPFDLLNR